MPSKGKPVRSYRADDDLYNAGQKKAQEEDNTHLASLIPEWIYMYVHEGRTPGSPPVDGVNEK